MHSWDNHQVEPVGCGPSSFALAEICRQPKRFPLDSWNSRQPPWVCFSEGLSCSSAHNTMALRPGQRPGIVESIFRIVITESLLRFSSRTRLDTSIAVHLETHHERL